MQSVSAAPLVTEEEFLALPESADKIELLDGEIILSPSPTTKHQLISIRLSSALVRWSETASPAPIILASPLDVRFAKGRILQPDVAVFFRPLDTNQAGPITQIPSLCFEISSSNREYDRVTKRFVYGAAGVEEYWVIDPARRVERFFGANLYEREEVEGVLQSALLPGFTLPLSALLA